jgi:SAM-dependent methyltransferase
MNKTLTYYENNAQILSCEYESAKIDNLHQLLLETFTSGSYLLEIGCGSGRDASFMIKHGYKILAIDGSEKMIEEAKRLHPELKNSLKVLSVPSELNFKSLSFDGVYSIATLMHLPQNLLDIAFNKIYNLLKPNGKFVFSVPLNRDDIDETKRDHQGRYFMILSKSEWIQLCKEHQFEIEYIDVTNDGLGRSGINWLTCIVKKR